MAHRPLRATDRRKGKVKNPEKQSESGSGSPLADIFNDRRHANGAGKRAR